MWWVYHPQRCHGSVKTRTLTTRQIISSPKLMARAVWRSGNWTSRTLHSIHAKLPTQVERHSRVQRSTLSVSLTSYCILHTATIQGSMEMREGVSKLHVYSFKPLNVLMQHKRPTQCEKMKWNVRCYYHRWHSRFYTNILSLAEVLFCVIFCFLS